ncbi:penicillin-binding transpeptidase domain-containing protein [Actinacidiphila sp. ITFR-21]|uniref:penicillin-binding transpeptidase domain-containing protein n=1 Tax=Actinacidiphila sp. ITFR-21 TaxID=3075199 RepID=UPI00288A529A|nr:penicillin-binding transpeptidase domain-containing protein [Streptomyces sp. ITFR-21]WNI17965.1 penicillin-binding transpeptidase domain-containing protein [Streptomyces sp. ITFR-21]
MNRCIRYAAGFCVLLLAALLVNAGRVQLVEARAYAGNPADRRIAVARYRQPRGDILVGGHRVTGSRRTGGQLRYERTYADGPLYAPVTGFASQIYGTTLLEGTEDALLAGTDRRLDSVPLWHEITRVQQRGGDVHTTIDPAAQRAAAAGLAGRKGAVAALDPATGRILALVSSPSYDPTALAGAGREVTRAWRRLTADEDQPMLDRAIRQTYPPGSTFKVVTAAAALQGGLVRDLRAPTDSPDPYRLPGTAVSLGNEGPGCADASVYDAFRVSCNTVFAKLGADLGADAMVDQAERFGFNDTRLRLPPRVAESTVDTAMSADQVALSAIGQFDTTATPLQMAMVAAAVGDKGRLMRPRLVDKVTNHSGLTVASYRPELLRQAVSARTAGQLRQLMEAVVTAGTGANAAVPGAVVGGKTGTAQHGRGNAGTPYAWFIGYAVPRGAAAASVAVAVVVEDAAAARADVSGGGDAAPVARSVMAAVLGARRGRTVPPVSAPPPAPGPPAGFAPPAGSGSAAGVRRPRGN